MPSSRQTRSLRFLAAALAVTLLYVAIDALQMRLVHHFAVRGQLGGKPELEFADEAREIQARSTPLEANRSAGHRYRVFNLGLRLGYLSQWLGGYGKQPEETMAMLRKPVEPMIAQMDTLAAALGIGPVAMMPVRTTAEFSALTARLENDEWGIAARIEAAGSPRDQHLFQFAVHAGVMLASLEGKLDLLPVPQSKLIGRHATLAGIAPEVWKPLARLDTDGDRAHTLAAYRAALEAVERTLVPVEAEKPATAAQ